MKTVIHKFNLIFLRVSGTVVALHPLWTTRPWMDALLKWQPNEITDYLWLRLLNTNPFWNAGIEESYNFDASIHS